MAISATIDNRAKWCCRFFTDGDELKDIFAFLTVGLHIVTPLYPLLNGKPLKGWLLSPLAQNLRTALLPSTVPKGQLSVFSPVKILLTYLCFYKLLLTLLQNFLYQNLVFMCQIQMLTACKWQYFLFFCQYASFNVILCHISVYFSGFLIAPFSRGYIFPFWMHFPNFLFPNHSNGAISQL